MTYPGFCRKSCVARGLFLAIVILFSVQLVWSAELEGFENVGDAHDIASDAAGLENAGLDIEEDGPVSHLGRGQPGKAQLKYEEATTLIEVCSDYHCGIIHVMFLVFASVCLRENWKWNHAAGVLTLISEILKFGRHLAILGRRLSFMLSIHSMLCL